MTETTGNNDWNQRLELHSLVGSINGTNWNQLEPTETTGSTQNCAVAPKNSQWKQRNQELQLKDTEKNVTNGAYVYVCDTYKGVNAPLKGLRGILGSVGSTPHSEASVKPSERSIEQTLARAVRQAGGLAIKLTSPSLQGLPDRLILLPEGRVCFVEVKAPGAKPKPHQARRHAQLAALGFQTIIVDTPEQARRITHEI